MIEVCTTNFGNLNRPHFSFQIFTFQIANQVKKPDIKQFFTECDAYMLKQ